MLRYNDEERSKTAISKTLARVQRLRDQTIFLLRRFRPAEEILNFSPDTLWRRAERFAAEPISGAEAILKEQAIPAQQEGSFTKTIADRKSTRLNSSHSQISYAVFCLKKKKTNRHIDPSHY